MTWAGCIVGFFGSIYYILYVPGSKVVVLGMVIPPLIGNQSIGYINPYYWVDDHPLSQANNGSLDPGTYVCICNCKQDTSNGIFCHTIKRPSRHQYPCDLDKQQPKKIYSPFRIPIFQPAPRLYDLYVNSNVTWPMLASVSVSVFCLEQLMGERKRTKFMVCKGGNYCAQLSSGGKSFLK